MSGPGSIHIPRLPLITLLAALGIISGARPAGAMGCHADDRPRLGLSFAHVQHAGPGWPTPPPHDASAPKFAPRPCTGDVPTSPERAELVGSFAATVAEEPLLTAGSTPRPHPDSDLAPLGPASSRLERPPRRDA